MIDSARNMGWLLQTDYDKDKRSTYGAGGDLSECVRVCGGERKVDGVVSKRAKVSVYMCCV